MEYGGENHNKNERRAKEQAKKSGKAEKLLLQHQRDKENKKLTKGKERASDGKKIHKIEEKTRAKRE